MNKNDIIGFWKPGEKYGEFSQWWKDRNKKFLFKDETYSYICAEQYMMAQKAWLFDDMETFHMIMEEEDPSKMKKYGRLIKNFDTKIWDKNKEDIVYRGNYLKFSQNERLKKLLIETGDKVLCEASPFDKIWGIGMSVDDDNFENEDEWGENLLGKILMAVRRRLKA